MRTHLPVQRLVEFDIQELDLATRTVVGTITTATIDRYREIVVPDGIQLDNYRRNPVVLLNHGRSYDLPIGRNMWIKPQKKGLVASTEFDDSAIGLDVLRMYDKGFMRAWSIGFMGIKWESADEAKTGYWRRWTETELLEYSAVTVPANPDAVSNALTMCEDPMLRDMLDRELHEMRCAAERERAAGSAADASALHEVVARLVATEQRLAALEEQVGHAALVERILTAPVDEPASPQTSPRLERQESFEERMRRILLLSDVSGRSHN